MTDDRIPGRQRTGGAGLRLAAVGWILYWAARAPDAGQWDSFDYLKQIVTHRPSDLGFGRPIFLGYNIALWEATKKALDLEPPAVAGVAVAATVALGGLGVFLFHRAARRRLEPAAFARLRFVLRLRHDRGADAGGAARRGGRSPGGGAALRTGSRAHRGRIVWPERGDSRAGRRLGGG